MARELGLCVCRPVLTTLQGLRVSRLLERFILGEEALRRAPVSISHSLEFVHAIHVRAFLDHRVSDPRTLRRRDNTDGRNSFKSIFFNGDMSDGVHTLWRWERHHSTDTRKQ